MNATDQTRIAIVGAGAIGGWIGAKLALAGETVMALTSAGLLGHVEIAEGGQTEQADFTRFDGPANVLIVAVKAPALSNAAEAARALVGPETLVVPMLNGVPWWFTEEPLGCVDPSGRIARALPTGQVVGTVIHAACHRSGPDQIVVAHADRLILGELDGEPSERVSRLFAMLHRAGLRPDITGDVRRAIWYKLWGNATINPLSALTRATADKLLADAAIRAFMLEAMAELATVGAAIGCPLEESGEDRMAVTARLGQFKPSMLQDVEAGRTIELEALVGAPREIASRFGIPTPALDRIYALTRAMGESLNLL